MEQEDLFPGSHDYKAVVAIFESFPKDELFAATAEDLRATIITLLGLEEHTQVRLFVLPDLEGRSVSAIVALPRDRVSTDLRIRLQNLFEERFDGDSVDYHLSFGEVDPARFHFTIHVRGAIPDVPVDELRARGDRRLPELGRRPLRRPGRGSGRDRRPRAGAPLRRRSSPTTTSRAAAMYLARFDVTQFERLSAETPYVVALQNEIDTAGAADPAEALQDRRQGAAVRSAAGARGARPDGGRGGADPAPGRRRLRPVPPRLRRARPGRRTARPGAGRRPGRRHGAAPSGTAAPRATR